MIGSLGTVVFEVSSDYIKTFEDFSREAHARYAKHEVLGIKPIKQFLGPELDKIKLKINLSAAHGINPTQEINSLRYYMLKGKALPLMIGNKNLGKFTIETLNEGWTVVDNKGNLITAEIEIELEEYIDSIPKITKKVQSKVKKTSSSIKVSKKIAKKNTSKKAKKVTVKPKVTKVALLGTKMGGYTPI